MLQGTVVKQVWCHFSSASSPPTHIALKKKNNILSTLHANTHTQRHLSQQTLSVQAAMTKHCF